MTDSYKITEKINVNKLSTKMDLPQFHKKPKVKTEKEIAVYNRLTLIKMMMDKNIHSDGSYTWLSKK